MSQRSLRVSAIVIARNEESSIASCIAMLSFCDEVVVVDNGSTDRTSAIARSHRARVTRDTSDDFSVLHNTGASFARGEWLLYIDADEMVTKELASSIVSTLDMWRMGSPAAYALYRVNSYLGTRFPGGEWIVRLIRKDGLIGWVGALHETARVSGETARLGGALVHDTHRTLEEMVAKTNKWSETEAMLRFQAGHPQMRPWRIIRVFLTGFLGSFIKAGGWRVGTVGMMESLYQGFSLFITYAKLWEIQQNKSLK